MIAAADSFRALGNPVVRDQASSSLLSVEDGVATVSITGPIIRKPDIFARVLMGATDSEEIGTAIQEAASRPDIKAVFLDIDSPGGTVAGTPELAAAVSALDKKKPVYAFSSGLMASAAYWIASQARAIYATPSAQVGSIGVVQAVVDRSAAINAAGIKVEVFSVGKYKAMGAPGTPLTDDQRELIQSNLAEIAGEFHAAVLAKGRAIPADAMEGQTFSGRQAQRHNLAGMVQDRAEAMRRLKVYHAAVDTESRAMTTALEDQLLETRTQVDDLTRDYQAQTELLTENSTALDALRGEVELLSAEIETLKAERDGAQSQATHLITERDSASARVASMQSQITEHHPGRRSPLALCRHHRSGGTDRLLAQAHPRTTNPHSQTPSLIESHAQHPHQRQRHQGGAARAHALHVEPPAGHGILYRLQPVAR
jgi:signal peptide peptidase SppA